MRGDRWFRSRIALCPRAAARRDLSLEPGNIRFEIVQPKEEGVEPTLFHLAAPLPSMHEQADVTRHGILLPPEAEQLDLKLPLVE